MNILHQGIQSSQLSDILADELLLPIPNNIIVSDINTDTRTLISGQTFVAISGENFDGHDFIEQALKSKPNAIIVERQQSNCPIPQIVVKNCRIALGNIAKAIRTSFVEHGGKVIGITGSVGKTTNKQMLAHIFARIGKTHFTQGNLNNDLGVPFTWFALPDDAEYTIIEMGANHQGEITYLSSLTKPKVAMITNAGQAHLEGFGGLDGVAKGKGELFSQLASGDIAIINADDDYAEYWSQQLAAGVSALTFSLNKNDATVYAENIKQSNEGTQFALHYNNQHIDIHLPTQGIHNVLNALGCSACALALGVTFNDIANGLAVFSNASGRQQTTQIGNIKLIDDTYNASPLSMQASAEILAHTSGYTVMVIGDMAELGSESNHIHSELGKQLREKADVFLCVGERMNNFAKNNNRAIHFSCKYKLNEHLKTFLLQHSGATVLFKGSRSMQMEDCFKYIVNSSDIKKLEK